MSPRLFGTDGIRGRAGGEPLTLPTMRRLGAALAGELAEGGPAPRVLVAGDTRGSTPEIRSWIVSGLAAAGARPLDLGTLPTAAIAHLVRSRGAAAGVVVSASHNPAEDNGVKLVAADGFKWSTERERALERRLAAESDPPPRATAAATPEEAAAARDEDARTLRSQLGAGTPLSGLRLALDCAHGAASGWDALFADAGARVESLFDRPDGNNINRGCGATAPEKLAARVRGGDFDLGFAFDGDADRALLVDERGEVRDGDAMLYLWAGELARRGELVPPRVVATSMSNLGLERALAALGIGVERCDVGDRHVVEMLRRLGLRLGGEQSGHLLDLRRSTTGDGLLTALVLAEIVARAGRPASELLAGFRRYPQLLVNVRVRAKPPLASLPEVSRAARDVESRLAGDGRLVLRYSGTEPLARIMLEGPDQTTIDGYAEELAAAIRTAIGAD